MNHGQVLLIAGPGARGEGLAETARQLGHRVATADGARARRELEAARPDLVLVHLPSLTGEGFGLCREIKNTPNWGNPAVVVVTSLATAEQREQAAACGADSILKHPVQPVELSACLGTLFRLKAAQDRIKRQQAMLEDQVVSRTRELRAALGRIRGASLETIFRLAQAGEFRDEITGNHVARMANYAAVVARGLRLGEDLADAVLYASPLHDIGKIGTPDDILLKPGRLDSREWEVMRLHTVFGARILADSANEFLYLGEVIARHHHERWDGTGYPDGLAGDNIPLEARIVAICDVFDALVSPRPYKGPMPVDQALDIVGQGRGSQFDPEVYDAFFASVDEIKTIAEIYVDH